MLIHFLAFLIKQFVFIVLICIFFVELVAAKPLVLRIATVASRQDAETILTRMRRDTPLSIGARGIAQVRVLSQKQIEALPRFLKDTIQMLKVGEHTRIIREKEAYSIYQVTTFENYLQASSLYKQGRIREALQSIEKDLIINPDHIRSLTLLGRIFEERGEYRRAVEGYRQLIGFNPDSPFGFQMIGRVYEIEKRWDQAVENYEISLKLDPEQHEILNNLALIYAMHRNQIERGIRLIEKALRLRPNVKKYEATLLKLKEMQVARPSTPQMKRAKRKKSRLAKTDLVKREKIHLAVEEKPTPATIRRQLPVPPANQLKPLEQSSDQENKKRLHEVHSGIGSLRIMSPSLQEKEQKNKIKTLTLLGLMKKNRVSIRAESNDNLQPFRLQILDGTGNLTNAKRLRTNLTKKGIHTETIGVSERGLWKQTILYHKKGYERHAEMLVQAISGSILLRPLTWVAPYDMILVLGKDMITD